LKTVLLLLCWLGAAGCTAGRVAPGGAGRPTAPAASRPPNILLILADDLGYGEVGCYGQRVIRTPNLDALAARGVRFTDAYSGSPVCASSRCCLLTGLHSGHAAIRDNKEIQPEGQEPLPAESVTIARVLKERGYATAAIGKWGLGPPGSTGDPGRHGFDLFFGYNCQRHAHNHCPAYLCRNGERIELPGNREKYERGDAIGPVYAPDLFRAEAESFIRARREGPFFLAASRFRVGDPDR
jgi:arylsulfatase